MSNSSIVKNQTFQLASAMQTKEYNTNKSLLSEISSKLRRVFMLPPAENNNKLLDLQEKGKSIHQSWENFILEKAHNGEPGEFRFTPLVKQNKKSLFYFGLLASNYILTNSSQGQSHEIIATGKKSEIQKATSNVISRYKRHNLENYCHYTKQIPLEQNDYTVIDGFLKKEIANYDKGNDKENIFLSVINYSFTIPDFRIKEKGKNLARKIACLDKETKLNHMNATEIIKSFLFEVALGSDIDIFFAEIFFNKNNRAVIMENFSSFLNVGSLYDMLSSHALIKYGIFNLNKDIGNTQTESEKNQTVIKAIWSFLVDDELPLLLIKDYEKENIKDISLYSDKFLFLYAASKYMKNSKIDITTVTISDALTLGKYLCQYAENEHFPPRVVNFFWLPALFYYIKFSKNVDILSNRITTGFKIAVIKKLFYYHGFFINNDIYNIVYDFNNALSKHKTSEEIKSTKAVMDDCQGIVSKDDLAELGSSDEYRPICVHGVSHDEAKSIFMSSVKSLAEKFKKIEKYLISEAITNLPFDDLLFIASPGVSVDRVHLFVKIKNGYRTITPDREIIYFSVEDEFNKKRVFSLKKTNNGTYIALPIYGKPVYDYFTERSYSPEVWGTNSFYEIKSNNINEMHELIADDISNKKMEIFSDALFKQGYTENTKEKIINILSYIIPFHNCIVEKNIGHKVTSCALDVLTLIPVVGAIGKVSISLAKPLVNVLAKSTAQNIAQNAVKKSSIDLIKTSIRFFDPGLELTYRLGYKTVSLGRKGTKKLIKLLKRNDHSNRLGELIGKIKVNKYNNHKLLHLSKENKNFILEKEIVNIEKNEEIQYMMVRQPNEHMRSILPEHPRRANVNYCIEEHLILLREEFRARAVNLRRMQQNARDIFIENEDWLFDETMLTILKNNELENAIKAGDINNLNEFLPSLFIDANAHERLLGQGEYMQRDIINAVRENYIMEAVDFTNNPYFRAGRNEDINYNLLNADPDILFHRCHLPVSQELRNQYPVLNNLHGMVENQIEFAHQSINQALENIISMSSKIRNSHLYTAAPKSYLETYLKKVLQTNDKKILDQAVTRIRLHALRIKQFFDKEDYKSKIILAVTNNAIVTAEHKTAMAFIYPNDSQERIFIMLNNFYLNPDFTDLHITLFHEASHIKSATQDFLVSPLARRVGSADELMEEFNLALDNYELKKYLSQDYYEKQNNIESIFFNEKILQAYQEKTGKTITNCEFIYKVRHDPMLKINLFMENADFVAKILSDFSRKIRADREFFPHVNRRSIADESPHMKNMFFAWILSNKIDSSFIVS